MQKLQIQQLLSGQLPCLLARGVSSAACAGILSGSFNPLHAGHLQMVEVAERLLGGRVAFEISVRNVDKSTLDAPGIQTRLAQFRDHSMVFLTHAATFVEKAQLFPKTTFVVGIDTIQRVADARYYDGSAARDAALTQIAGQGCRFLVFGRSSRGKFRELSACQLPPRLLEICTGVSEETFRNDLSSTLLRQDGA